MYKSAFRCIVLTLSFLAAGLLNSTAQTPYSPSSRCTDQTDPACVQSQPDFTREQGYPVPPTQPQTNANSNQSPRDVYVDSGGFPAGQNNSMPTVRQPNQLTDLQRLARESTGDTLPIFGQEMFLAPPSTFAPVDQIPVLADYVLGPGDEVLLRIWGHTNFNGRLTVDRSGSIYIPQVGAVNVAGQRFSDLQPKLQRELSRTYHNFEFSVGLGRLRSIQVFVLGEARRPGSYTVSSLSTAFNALIASGGPTSQGSMRNIELRRGNATVSTIDLYDFVLRGDKSKDVPLQAGDVLFIPFVGPQAAMSGGVRHPAIYEVHGETTVGDLIQLAGGLSSTAAGTQLRIERIDEHHVRQAMSLSLDRAGLATKVADGDVLYTESMLRGYKDSVTIRGNLANPGRFPWHPGMKLSDIIPDRQSLLTRDYWRERNALGLPTPLFESSRRDYMDNSQPQQQRQRSPYPSTVQGEQLGRTRQQQPGTGYPDEFPRDTRTNADDTANPAFNGLVDQNQPQEYSQQDQTRDLYSQRTRNAQPNQMLPDASSQATRGSLAEQQQIASDLLTSSAGTRVQIQVPVPEIDWSYAVIERLDPNTLRNSLVPFNLGRLVNEHLQSEDKVLQPGDVVTILSQADVHVTQDEQTKYIRLEGEIGSSGVYSVSPNETLADVVRRAGGLTNKAYLFGASFTRVSARVLQQERLDEYVASLTIQTERASSIRALSATTPTLSTGQPAEEVALLDQLRRMRATGRVVLEFAPTAQGADAVPAIPLENGDTFRVPSRPLIVSVVGSVYGQNVFLYDAGRRVRDYLRLAGKPNRIADRKHSFIIRADGSILSEDTVRGGLWGEKFEAEQIFPGDTIVVPEKPIKPSTLRDVIDWSQVFSSFAIGAAAIQVIK